jgi:hypothetical protein
VNATFATTLAIRIATGALKTAGWPTSTAGELAGSAGPKPVPNNNMTSPGTVVRLVIPGIKFGVPAYVPSGYTAAAYFRPPGSNMNRAGETCCF